MMSSTSITAYAAVVSAIALLLVGGVWFLVRMVTEVKKEQQMYEDYRDRIDPTRFIKRP